MKIQGAGTQADTQRRSYECLNIFWVPKQVKSDIENFKRFIQIEDDGGIGGKFTCVLLISINKEWSNSKNRWVT